MNAPHKHCVDLLRANISKLLQNNLQIARFHDEEYPSSVTLVEIKVSVRLKEILLHCGPVLRQRNQNSNLEFKTAFFNTKFEREFELSRVV